MSNEYTTGEKAIADKYRPDESIHTAYRLVEDVHSNGNPQYNSLSGNGLDCCVCYKQEWSV